MTNVSGCDGTAILNLVIENITFVYDASKDFVMEKNISIGNNIYSQSGTYTDTIQNLNGYDSIVLPQLKL